MTAIAVHRVRTAKGNPLEPVGVWVADSENVTAFYPRQHLQYRDRGWKAIVERPMESAEQWIAYKASTSPNWQLYEPMNAVLDLGVPDAASVYDEVRHVFDTQIVGQATPGANRDAVRAAEPNEDNTTPTPGGWGANRFAIAQSWWIASELVRRHPELIVYEMHPGGGQYDVLCVAMLDQFTPNARANSPRVMLNRVGTIQIHRGYDTEVVADWSAVLEANDPHQFVKELEVLTGWGSPISAPPTAERVIGYRFFATALALLVNDRHVWDVRSESVDSSASGLSRAGLITAFPDVEAALRQTPRLGIHGEPHSHYWAIRRGVETVAVVSMEGDIHRQGMKRHALMDAYQESDRRLPVMTTELLRTWL